LCGGSIAVPKKHDVERHLQANRSSFDANYPFKYELRKKKIKELNQNSQVSSRFSLDPW
jgi:hypothetical protein